MRFQRIIEIVEKQKTARVDESFGEVMGAIGGALGSLVSGILQGLAQAVNQSSKDYQHRVHRWGNEFERKQHLKEKEKRREETEKIRQGRRDEVEQHRQERLDRRDQERRAREAESEAHNAAIQFFVEQFNTDRADLETFRHAMAVAYRDRMSEIITMLERVDAEMLAAPPPPHTPPPHAVRTEDELKSDIEAGIRSVAAGMFDPATLLSRLNAGDLDYILDLFRRSEARGGIDAGRLADMRRTISDVEELQRVGTP
ncbi:MAG: hypothetical protein WCP55_01300 [Lentisphaerota bacterium]